MSTGVFNNLASLPKEVLTRRLTAYYKGFAFFAPIATLIFRPLLLNRVYCDKGMPDNQRRVLVLQEGIGQVLNVAVHVTSFLGMMLLTKKFLKNTGLTDTANSLIEGIAGTLASFLGMGFIAPIVGGKVLHTWMSKNVNIAPPPPIAAQAPPPLRRIAPAPVMLSRPPVARPPMQQPTLAYNNYGRLQMYR